MPQIVHLLYFISEADWCIITCIEIVSERRICRL